MTNIQDDAKTNEAVVSSRMRTAYEQTAERRAALKDEDLRQVNLDVFYAVQVILGSTSETNKLREAVRAAHPDFDQAHFDHLPQCALALGAAQARFLAASTQVLPVQELSGRLVEKHDVLEGTCKLLAKRGLINGQRLKELKGTVGYTHQVSDSMLMVELLRTHWDDIHDKVPITAAELDEVEVICEQLLTALGERDQLPITSSAAANDRKRAFTLFMISYDALRREAEHARYYEGDADKFVPGLQARGKKAKAPEVAEPDTSASGTHALADDEESPFISSGEQGLPRAGARRDAVVTSSITASSLEAHEHDVDVVAARGRSGTGTGTGTRTTEGRTLCLVPVPVPVPDLPLSAAGGRFLSAS